MPGTYIRFVTAELHPKSGQPMGVFSALYKLEDDGQLEEHELTWLHAIEKWFNKNLKAPKRVLGSRRRNSPDRAVSWFRASAVEHVTRMHELCALLRHKDVLVEVLQTTQPGYIVYEDEFQVATIPFK